ncbi:argininosuccinate synthase [Micromonospora sp. DT46]|uniref:argininosuccinate synthase n=1 Tax=unclassified Micromonospora TaxID=2617518 RepID=UPI00124B82B9|nr:MULTISPECIES: argininosuccinate synthase [unclassified Micromonospora]KAB1160070.1 argininosuccinate synthase [Micromonospora sp. AMSO12t]WSG04060.1 argininosuccinate synthase [Micromonospora sp. NBC_01740]
MSTRNNIAPQHIVLAFSGGLDTSVALVWLKERYRCRLTAFIADLGQGEELDTAARKAEKLGADEVRVVDLREEFARDYAFPMYRANALYEGQYLMGSSIGRPLIAAAQVRVAEEVGADAVAHGATGKGNDQIRFEMTFAALRPDLTVISPWREWDLASRSDLLAYAGRHGIELDLSSGERPYSIDSNLLHTSYEGEALEDPAQPAPEGLLFRVRDIADTPDEPETVEIHFQGGNPVGVNGTPLSASAVLEALDEIGRRHGIGRLDIVENRIFGMKTRNIYEAPSGSLLWHAHRAVESLVLDPEVAQLKEELMPKYTALVYRGLWFAPERLMLQTAIDFSQQDVTGDAILRVHRGTVQVIGRRSPHSRYDTAFATFEADDVFDQRDSSGWLRVNTVRFRAGRATRAAKP